MPSTEAAVGSLSHSCLQISSLRCLQDAKEAEGGGAGSSQQREQERDFVSVLEEPEQLWLSFLGWTGAAFTAAGAGEPAMLRDTDPVPRSCPWPSA